MSPEEDWTRDAVDSEPKHYQLSYSGPDNDNDDDNHDNDEEEDDHNDDDDGNVDDDDCGATGSNMDKNSKGQRKLDWQRTTSCSGRTQPIK